MQPEIFMGHARNRPTCPILISEHSEPQILMLMMIFQATD
ncbi:hypothetical protein FORC065_2948 [Yersinia enterocolitica]|nr:hypothetical protein FORC065_2948 [Yersinia enterocolitica]